MATISADTSFWIKFFTGAGIPAGDAAHYAIVFSDNRISKEMLLDLSKEYLTDMGVTRLGDVIAILKHAKKVHNEEAKDHLLKSSPMTLRSNSPAMNTPRRSTAASRILTHYVKQSEAMNQQSSPRPVSPDLPSTSSKRKVSVFERLGAEGGDVTVSVPKGSPDVSGVFSRLGGKSAMKRSVSATSLDKDSSGLPYIGVLKNTNSPVKKKKRVEVVVATPIQVSTTKNSTFKQIKQIRKTIQTNASAETTVASIQRPEVSTTQGVLSSFAKKDTPSLRERLGSKTEQPSSTTMLTMDKTTSQTVKLKARLGAKKEDQSSSPIVTSTQQIKVKLKAAKAKSMKSNTEEKAAGVFSRLGKLSKV